MNWQEKKLAEEQRRIEETGGNQTVFSVSHSEIRKTGITMCKDHSWEKLNEMEIYCTLCPTVLIVNADVLDSYLQNT